MKADPPLDAKCRDKFLVQSAPITPDKEFASIASVVSRRFLSFGYPQMHELTTLSSQLETTDKAAIFERKIRVNWLAAGDSPDNGASAAHSVMATPSKQAAVNGVRIDLHPG
jgi:hypothetical protein